MAPLDGKIFEEEEDEYNQRFLDDAKLMAKVMRSIPIADINPDDYQVVLYSGGSGPMWDFPNNPDINRISRSIYEKDGIQFWGMQYHPELTPGRIAELVAEDGLFSSEAELANNLKAVDKNPNSESVKHLGIKSSDPDPKMRMRELTNWLDMIQTSAK